MRRCRAWPTGRSAGSSTMPRKFTAREVRRERRYDGILLDPPKFGRGPEGEVWRLEEISPGLLADCRKLLDAEQPLPRAHRLCGADVGARDRRTGEADARRPRRHGRSRRDGGARGSARAAAADRDLRALGSRSDQRGSRRRPRTARRPPAAAKRRRARQRAGSRCRARRAGAEDQQRHRERQQQQARERAAAAQAGGQRGDHDRERGEARRADQQRQLEPDQHVRRSFDQRRGGSAASSSSGPKVSQWPRPWPARRFLAMPAQGQLVEHAVGPVRLDQPLDRQQGGEQGGNPQAPPPVRSSSARRARPRTGPVSRPAGRRRPAARPRRRSRRRSRAGSGRDHAQRHSCAPSSAERTMAMRPAPRRRAARCAAISASSRARQSASRPLSGSSSSQSGAPLAHTRASAARFAGRSKAGGPAHRRGGRGPSRAIACVEQPSARPEGQRAPSGSRGRAPGARPRAPTRSRSTVPAAGRSSPAARRIRLDLPLPLGPVTSAASPGAELQIQLFEQQPPAAPAGHALRSAAAASPGLLLERVHVLVGEAEMMADLVDQDVRDEARGSSPLGPFVEDRAAEQADHRSAVARGPAALLAHRAARRCRSGRTDPRCPSLEHRIVGELLDRSTTSRDGGGRARAGARARRRPAARSPPRPARGLTRPHR